MLSLIVRQQTLPLVLAADRSELRRQLQRALRAAGLGDVQVCLALSDDAELRALNLTYAGEDHATDVLSFAQRDQHRGAAPPYLPAGVPEPLGDIIISVETAARQATAQGHELLHELLHLSVHGLCHLIGYDHTTVEEERVMFAYEARLREQARGRGRVQLQPCAFPTGPPVTVAKAVPASARPRSAHRAAP